MSHAQERLWHGGAPGLRAGQALLPPSETNAFSRRTISVEEGLPNITQRLDRVYATTARDLAHAWAALYTPDGHTYPGGALYRVDLEDAEPDADLPAWPGWSVQAAHCHVINVYDAYVPRHDKHLAYLRGILDENQLRQAAADATPEAPPEEIA